MKNRVPFLLFTAIMVLLPIKSMGESCEEYQEELSLLLQENYCTQDSDCAALQLPSPFGCNRAVNKKLVDQIESIFNEYDALCGPFLFQCLRPASIIECNKNLCVPKTFGIPSPNRSNATIDHNGRPYYR